MNRRVLERLTIAALAAQKLHECLLQVKEKRDDTTIQALCAQAEVLVSALQKYMQEKEIQEDR